MTTIDIFFLVAYTVFVAVLIPFVAMFTMKFGTFGYYRGIIAFHSSQKRRCIEDGEVKEESPRKAAS